MRQFKVEYIGINYFHRCLGTTPSEIFTPKVSHALKMIILKVDNAIGDSFLNKLDTATKGTKRFSNPQALSSALATLRTLQP